MTPREHERAVGVLQATYGALHVLVLTFAAFFFLMGGAVGGGRAVTRLLETFALFTGVMSLVLGWLPLVTGYGLLKGRRWARPAGFASCAAMLFNFPFGTALGAYSLWYFLAPGKQLESAKRLQAMRAAKGEAAGYGWESRLAPEPARRRATPRLPRSDEYVKPPEPYGWRGED
jgi:hypothetical protein